MEKLLVIFMMSALSLEISAQVPFLGRCPSTAVVQNFNLNDYLGRWYEIRSYPAIFQIGGACVQAQYSLNPNGTVRVLNSMQRFGKSEEILGNARLLEPGVGKLNVNFPSTGFNSDRANYIVVSTDYVNYAVVHSCNEVLSGFLNIQFSWILSRRPQLTDAENTAINSILQSNGISKHAFTNTRQTNCPAR